MKSKVSIILPVYNALKFIQPTVESVLLQSHQEWELIIIDDCSPDGTYEYIKSKYSSDPRIVFAQNDVNSGAGITRNLGLKLATGSLIAFIDADDIWLENKLEKQLNYMEKLNSAIVHTSYSFINEEGNKIPGKVSVSEIVDLRSYMRNTEIGMSTSLINKDIVGEFSFNPMRTRQDTRLWLDLLSLGFVANGLDEVLVNYRVREGQISGNKFVIAYRTFKVYFAVKNIPIKERLINYCFYAVNGVLKRFKK